MANLELKNIPDAHATEILVKYVIKCGDRLYSESEDKIHTVSYSPDLSRYHLIPAIAAIGILNGTLTPCINPRKTLSLVRVYKAGSSLMRVYEDPSNRENNCYDYWSSGNRWEKGDSDWVDRETLNRYTIVWSSNGYESPKETMPLDGTEWVYHQSGCRFKVHDGEIYSIGSDYSRWNLSGMDLKTLKENVRSGACRRFNPDLSVWTWPKEPAWMWTVTDYIE